MAIRVALSHKTRYRYERDVWLSPQVVRLHPAPHCRTPVPSYSLKVVPKDHFINWQQDPYSNRLARLVFPKKTREFSVEVDLVAELTVINPFDFFLENYAEQFPFRYDPVLARELAPYLEGTAPGPRLSALVREVRQEKIRTVDYLVSLNRRIQEGRRYVIRLEPGIQGPEESLGKQSGSCRDSAWLMVQLLRQLGLASRFVSGYLIQLAPDVKSLDGPSGAERDFTDLHAWAEVFIPGGGWVGMDPRRVSGGEGHLPLACSPIRNRRHITAPTRWMTRRSRRRIRTYGASRTRDQVRFRFCDVSHPHPRGPRHRPYSDGQWGTSGLGARVDQILQEGDVRLTMGGEPTFVSVDDMDGDEWNSLALGPAKRRLAGILFRRLAERFAKGPLLHFGQGKWYPGEPLPRWALGCFWRKDGEPIWRDPSLIANDSRPIGATAELSSGPLV
jgi:transglutaminase-like putative cysteine protease